MLDRGNAFYNVTVLYNEAVIYNGTALYNGNARNNGADIKGYEITGLVDHNDNGLEWHGMSSLLV